MKDLIRLIFLDWNAVHRILQGHDMKIAIIVAGYPDMLQLQCKALLLGGLQCIVNRLLSRLLCNSWSSMLHALSLLTP